MPISPSRQPNMRTCTEDRAPSTSARIRGKKLVPSTQGSIVAAVDHAKSSAASWGRTSSRAASASVADSAPDAVTALAGGGQLGRWVIPSTCRKTTTRTSASTRGRRPPPSEQAPGGADVGVGRRVPEKRHGPDDGGCREHHARGEDDQEAVRDARAEDVTCVEPVLDRRPADHERATERADHSDPGATVQHPCPEECRACQEDAQPPVVRALRPVERHVALRDPRAEHAEDDCDDRDPAGEAPTRGAEGGQRVNHPSRHPSLRYAARGSAPSRATHGARPRRGRRGRRTRSRRRSRECRLPTPTRVPRARS